MTDHIPAEKMLARLRAAINDELPRTHKGFRCQYEQDVVMRALDKAFAKVTQNRPRLPLALEEMARAQNAMNNPDIPHD